MEKLTKTGSELTCSLKKYKNMDFDELNKQDNYWGKDSAELLKRYINFALVSGKKLTALDLGAGTGRNSIFLKELGFEVLALDFSTEAIEKLKELGINTVKEDLDNFSFDNEYFDLAIAFDVLDFCTNPKKILSDIKAHSHMVMINVFAKNFTKKDFQDIFTDWQILKLDQYYYTEKHGDLPIHQHECVEFVAINNIN